MKIGVLMFPTEYSISPVELGREVEAHGLESLWFPEHTHIPANRQSAFPRGTALPREYSHLLSPYLALTAVAATTTNLRLGLGVSLVIEHDPIVLAKEVATLDVLSQGRVLFGVGGGWNSEEMANHGTHFASRWQLLRERVEAMKAIWTQDEATYHGDMVNFDRIWSWPKPVQVPYPLILIGGDGPRTLHRVIRYGDGWIPIVGRSGIPLEQRMAELRELALQAGRERLPSVTAFILAPRVDDPERYEELGVDRVLLELPTGPRDAIMPLIEEIANRAARSR